VKKLAILFSILVVCGFLQTKAQQASTPAAALSRNVKGSESTSEKAKNVDPKAFPSPGDKQDKVTSLFGKDGSDRPKGPTEITAKDHAQFDSHGRTAVFFGSVKVVDPQFTMTADKLTAYLNREDEGGGLKQADAEGNVVIIHINQPKTVPSPVEGHAITSTLSPVATSGAPTAQAQQPVRSTIKSEKAVYVARDGTITLTGWPQVTQGVNTHIATKPGVKMVIYNDGRLQTFGSTRTIIQDKSQPNQQSLNGPS